MARGTAYLKEWEQRLLAERDSVVVTARCRFCQWSAVGTVRVTRTQHEEHRKAAHPELRPKPRRKRHRPMGQLQGHKSLDDNIAGARLQGGAGWAAPE